ncbi:hypothetical protein LRS06_04245 [Hymenobacter sp. J193]|uniref:hypothetical protein n=1 Tax=Hymenobacter sp. J193 TaxID=2898429 RepID=UPI002151F9C2|nr:hypothetical protein [Hymenobacter sp. J193]MCR5886999.1 hypothetical protein [Hymenobacter sp. J193]
MFGYDFYFRTNPSQSEVIHRLQLQFPEPLVINQETAESVEVRDPSYKNHPVWLSWEAESIPPLIPEFLGVAPEMDTLDVLPFPDLLQNIGIRSPIFFHSGPDKLINAIRQILQDLGGKTEQI